MPKEDLRPHIAEFKDFVMALFRSQKTPKAAWEFFWSQQAELQRDLVKPGSSLPSYLDEHPHYVACALLSRVALRDTSESKRLLSDYSQVTIESLRAAKALGVMPEAIPVMDAIAPTGKLPKILALLALAERTLKLPPQPEL